MAPLAALVLMLGSAPTISLSAASTCAPREVLSQELTAAGVSFVPEGGVVLRLEHDGRLTLEKEGRVVLSRSLGNGTCEELGRAAAVVVVRWVHALEVAKPASLSPAGERVGERADPRAKPRAPPVPLSPAGQPRAAPVPPAAGEDPAARPRAAPVPRVPAGEDPAAKPRVTPGAPAASPAAERVDPVMPVSSPPLVRSEGRPATPAPATAKPDPSPSVAVSANAQPDVAPGPTPELPRDPPRDSVVAAIGTTPPTTDPVVEPPVSLTPSLTLSPTLSPAGERETVRVTSLEALAGGGLTAPGSPDPAPIISLELALLLNERLRIDLAGLFDFGGHVTVFDEAGLTRGSLATRGGLILPGAAYCLFSPVRLCFGAVAGARIVEGESSGPYVFKPGLSRVVAFVVGPNAQLAFTPGPFRVALDASLLVTPGAPSFSVEGLPTTLSVPTFQGLFRLSVGFGIAR